MDYIGFAYMGIGIFLGFRAAYLYERLKRYVDRQYPEEGKVIRSYEWQMYPWSVGHRTLKALIKREGANDPELARWAKKGKHTVICILAWCASFTLMGVVAFIRFLLAPPR